MFSIVRILSCVCLATALGCNPPAEDTSNNPSEPQTETAGGHDHSHDVGPHGGHIIDLKPSGAHAEWTHDDDTHTITVYLESFDGETITGVKFVAAVGDEVEEFPLTATDNGWSISSEALMTHINMGEASDVQLIVTDDTGENTSQIEAHSEHHH